MSEKPRWSGGSPCVTIQTFRADRSVRRFPAVEPLGNRAAKLVGAKHELRLSGPLLPVLDASDSIETPTPEFESSSDSGSRALGSLHPASANMGQLQEINDESLIADELEDAALDAARIDGGLTDVLSKLGEETDTNSNTQSSCESVGHSEAKSKRRRKRRQSSNKSELRLAEVEQQLENKTSLVQTLTAQLEQAAEQLDRIHRTGSDRQIRVAPSAIPEELIEQQQLMLDELQQAIQRWDDVQAGLTLERIERDVTEVRNLVSSSLRNGSFRPSDDQGPPADQADNSESDANSEATGEEPSLAAALARAFHSESRDSGSGKASASSEPQPEMSLRTMSMLGISAESTGAGTSEKPSDRTQGSESEPSDVNTDDIVLPTPIDYENANADQLIQSIEERDRYISLLIRKLRISERRSQPAGHWSELAEVPDQLREVLEELESRLNETARMAELDLSLERARLAREESKLRALEQRLQQQSKQYERCSEESSNPEVNSRASRRWLRFLGRPE